MMKRQRLNLQLVKIKICVGKFVAQSLSTIRHFLKKDRTAVPKNTVHNLPGDASDLSAILLGSHKQRSSLPG